MLKISKMTDYATAILLFMQKQKSLHSADYIAGSVNLELPTTSKVLKLLTKAEILQSTRGMNGGYKLARDVKKISVYDVIKAIEGEAAITDCTMTDSICNQMHECNSMSGWQKVNAQIQKVLTDMTLAKMYELNETGKTDIKLLIK